MKTVRSVLRSRSSVDIPQRWRRCDPALRYRVLTLLGTVLPLARARLLTHRPGVSSENRQPFRMIHAGMDVYSVTGPALSHTARKRRTDRSSWDRAGIRCYSLRRDADIGVLSSARAVRQTCPSCWCRGVANYSTLFSAIYDHWHVPIYCPVIGETYRSPALSRASAART